MADLEATKAAVGDADYGKLEQAFGDRLGHVIDAIASGEQASPAEAAEESGESADEGTTA